MPINEKITIDESQVLEGLDKIIKQFGAVEEAQKKTVKSFASGSNEWDKAIEEVTSSVDDLAKKQEMQSKATEEQRAVLKGAAKELTIFGVNIGQVQKAIQSKIVVLKALGGEMKRYVAQIFATNAANQGMGKGLFSLSDLIGKAKVAFSIFNTVLKASVIGIVVAALAGLVAMFKRTQAGADLLSRGMAILDSVMGNIVDRLSKLGNAVVDIFSGNFRKGINDAINSFAGLGEEIRKDAAAVDELTKRTHALRDANRDLSVEQAKANSQIEDYLFKSKDLALSEKERADFLRKAITLENEIGEKRLKLAEENLKIISETNDVNNSLAADLDKQAQAEIELEQIRSEISAKNREKFAEEQALRKAAADKAKARAEEEKKRIEELTKAYNDLAKEIQDRVTLADLDRLTGADRLEREKELALAEIDILEAKAKAAATAAGKSYEFETEFYNLRLRAVEAFNDAIFKLNREQQAASEAIFDKAKEAFVPTLEAARDFSKDLGDAIKPEEIFSDFEQSLIDQFGPELGKKLVEGMRKGTEVAVQQQNPFEKLKESIANSIGLDSDELGPVVDAINTVKEAILDNINSQIEANEALLDSIREQSSTIETELERQKELKEQGFANDTTLNERRLQKLKEDESKALEENKKLQRQKNALDSISQISSLLSASANIFQALSPIPFVGVPLAIAAIATMFGSFIAVKARASQATRLYKGAPLSELLGERTSGFVDRGGMSDVPGRGDGYRVEGTNLRIGGNEFLMSEGPSLEHVSFLKDMNRGKYKGMDLKKLAMGINELPVLRNYNISFDKRQQAIDEKNESNTLMAIKEGVVEAIGVQTHSLINYMAGQRKISPMGSEGYIEYSDTKKVFVKKVRE